MQSLEEKVNKELWEQGILWKWTVIQLEKSTWSSSREIQIENGVIYIRTLCK